MMPIPTQRLFILFAALFPLSLLGFFNPAFFYIAFFLDGVVVLVAMGDYIRLRRKLSWETHLEFPLRFSIGRKNRVTLTLINHSPQKVTVTASLDLPSYWKNENTLFVKNVSYRQRSEFNWILSCSKRGHYFFEHLNLIFYSPFNLLKLPVKRSIEKSVQVIPDIKALNRYIKLMHLNRSFIEGRHVNPFSGSGTELNYLREYHTDDAFKSIDWKATSRAGKPISKVYKNETAGSVWFVIDVGRMMLAEVKGLTALDHAINAILILSYIIIKAGDSVGMMAFNDRIMGEMPPVRGRAAIQKIRHFITQLHASSAESNYALVFEYLRRKLKKRSMIMVISDMMDDINYTVLNASLTYFNKRHLTVLILLKDVVLETCAQKEIETSEDIYISAGAKEMVMKRAISIQKLTKNGIGVLDLLPKELTASIINRYFEAKASNLL